MKPLDALLFGIPGISPKQEGGKRPYSTSWRRLRTHELLIAIQILPPDEAAVQGTIGDRDSYFMQSAKGTIKGGLRYNKKPPLY